jgi:hypothetical protein
MLYGTCMAKVNGRPVSPPIPLLDIRAAWNYVAVQKRLFPEVRVTAPDLTTVIWAIEEEIVHPADWRWHTWRYSKL